MLSAANAVAAVQGKQFLLFDVIHHEQVNKQRRALMFYLDLAVSLKRTLVLPRPRLLRRIGKGSNFAPDAEYPAWGELFNVSELSKLHPVVELEQYLELHRPTSLHVQINHKGCPETAGPTEVDFNGLRLPVERSVCIAGLQYDKAKLRSHADYASLESLAFSRSVDQLSFARALALRPHVRFEQRVYETAAAFVSEQFGGVPFIAVHWRRTDFLQVRS